jgi:hypothetical protein
MPVDGGVRGVVKAVIPGEKVDGVLPAVDNVVAEVDGPRSLRQVREPHAVGDGVTLHQVTLLRSNVPVYPAGSTTEFYAVIRIGRTAIPALVQVCRRVAALRRRLLAGTTEHAQRHEQSEAGSYHDTEE